MDVDMVATEEISQGDKLYGFSSDALTPLRSTAEL